jgi:hypothetical protein
MMAGIPVCETFACAVVPGYMVKYTDKIRKNGDDTAVLDTFNQLCAARNQFLGSVAITAMCGMGFYINENGPLWTRLFLAAGAAGGVYLMHKAATPLKDLAVSFYQAMNADLSQVAHSTYL